MDAVALLRLQVEWGADEALDEAPWNRLRPAPRPAPTKATPPQAPAPLPIPAAAAPAEARRLAEAAPTLDALRAAMAGFEGCQLRSIASSLVFGDGACDAGVAVIGEAPDAESDRSGSAFAGPGGRMLDAMLESVRLTRRDVRLLTLTPWRPPGGRAPSDAEIAACLPFTLRHLALLRPRAVVLLGNLACRWIGGIDGGVRRARGRWHELALSSLPEPVPALALPPLEHLLSQAASREAAWAELLRLRRALDAPALTQR